MTIAGLPSEALSALTEAPVITYIHRKFEDKIKLWSILKQCDDKNYIICTNTNNSTASREVGLVRSHAYSVISCYEFQGPSSTSSSNNNLINDEFESKSSKPEINDKTIRLLKIRNPWGNFEWNGDYSDKSDKWTKDLKEQVKFQDKDDGIFFMTFTDFLKFFPFTFVCKYNDGYNYKFKKEIIYNKDTMIGCKFKITQETKAVFGLHQKQERFYHKIKNYQPSHAKFFLVKYNLNSGYLLYDFIMSNEGCLDKIYLDLKSPLDEGEYLLVAHIKWPYTDEVKETDVVFSAYTDNSELDLHHLERKHVSNEFLNKLLISYIEKNLCYKILGSTSKGISYVSSFKDTDTGFFFLSLKNDNFKPCQITITIEKNDNVKLISQNVSIERLADNIYNYSVIVASMTSELVLFEQLDKMLASNQ